MQRKDVLPFDYVSYVMMKRMLINNNVKKADFDDDCNSRTSTVRLTDLLSADMVKRVVSTDGRLHFIYSLTEKGKAITVMMAVLDECFRHGCKDAERFNELLNRMANELNLRVPMLETAGPEQ